MTLGPRRGGRLALLVCAATAASTVLTSGAADAAPIDLDRPVAVDSQDRFSAGALVIDDPAPMGPFISHEILDMAFAADAEGALFEVPAAADVFALHSRPDADKTLYLDFDGHTTTGTRWNGGSRPASFTSAPYSRDANPAFDATERDYIARVWQLVAEDYAPFGVNVTTEEPPASRLQRDSYSDSVYGQRVVISPTSEWYGGSGGVAYVNSFKWLNTDTPAFVFSTTLGNGHWKYVGEAASHEAGHTLGLSHDGRDASSYYTGHGSGDNAWAPIMGVGFSRPITQWSRGEYSGATQLQDDIAILTQNLGPAGDSAAAVTLEHDGATTATITRGGGSAAFDVEIGAGVATFTASPTGPNGNLLARIDVFRGSTLVASGAPSSASNWVATASKNLPAGAYSVVVTSIGWGTADTGFTTYGSIGSFNLSVAAPAPTSTPTPPPATGSGEATSDGSTGDKLTAIAPQRLLDTRPAFGGRGRVSAGSITKVDVRGHHLIPANSTAAVLNVVAVNPSAAGYLEVTPCVSSAPEDRTATVTFKKGATVGNSTIAKLDATGRVCVFSLVATDIVVDVTGWLGPDGAGGLVTRTAKRIVDTREGLGLSSSLQPGVVRRVQLDGLVPAGTQAVAINLTAVAPRGAGYVSAYPCSQGGSSTSALNYDAWQTRTNNATIAIDSNLSFCVVSPTRTELVVDLNGHFATGGLTFVAASPIRLLDTRHGTTRLAPRTSTSYVAPDTAGGGVAKAVSVVVTAVDQNVEGYVTTWGCASRPLAAALTSVPYEASANSALVSLTNDGVTCLYTSTGANLVVDFNGWWI